MARNSPGFLRLLMGTSGTSSVFYCFFVLIVSDYPAQKGFIFGEYVGILEGPCDPGILEMVKLSFLTLFLDMVAFESSRFLVPF